MPSCPHTEFRRGQKLVVILRSGRRYVDSYVGKRSGAVVLRDHGRVRVRDIRALRIARGSDA